MMLPTDSVYVADVTIPAGFVDATHGNDVCPCFEDREHGMMLYVDHPDPQMREIEEAPRFSLVRLEPDGAGGWLMPEGDGTIAYSDDMDDVLAAIESVRA